MFRVLALLLLFTASLFAQTAPTEVSYKIIHLPEKGSDGNYLGYALLDSSGETVVRYNTYRHIKLLKGSVFAVQAMKKKPKDRPGWGLYDAAARREVLPTTADSLHLLSTGVLLVKEKSEQVVFLDLNGRQVSPRKYESLNHQAYSSAPELGALLEKSPALFSAKTKGKYGSGFVDASGREITPELYDSATYFTGNLARVTRAKLQGVIDATGREVVPPRHQQVKTYAAGLIAYTDTGVPDADGNLVGGWKLLTKDGAPLGTATYEQLAGYATTAERTEDVVLNARSKDGWVGLKPLQPDATGEPTRTYPALLPYSKDVKGETLWGYVYFGGPNMTPPTYSFAGVYYEGRAMVGRVVPGEFVNDLGGRKTPVKVYGVIDSTGAEIVPVRYRSIQMIEGGLFAVGEGSGAKGAPWRILVIDGQGRTLKECDYDAIQSLVDGRRRVVRGGRYGYLDADWKEVIAPQFTYAGDFNEGTAVVNDGQWRWIDRDGNTVLSGAGYLSVGNFENGRAQAFINRDPWGRLGESVILDRQGKVLEKRAGLPPPPVQRVRCESCGGTGDRYENVQREYSVSETDYYSALAPGGRVVRTRSGTYTESRRAGSCWTCNGTGYVLQQ